MTIACFYYFQDENKFCLIYYTRNYNISQFSRACSHYDVIVRSYIIGWYLLWYQWKEDVQSYTLVVNVGLCAPQYSPEKWLHNRIYCPSNRSKQIQETHTTYSAGTQYTRQSLNKKQGAWLYRQTASSVKSCMLFFIQTLPRILCAGVKSPFIPSSNALWPYVFRNIAKVMDTKMFLCLSFISSFCLHKWSYCELILA